MGKNNKDKQIGTLNKPIKILCFFKKEELLVIYPDHIGSTLPTHLYMYVNLGIQKLFKRKKIGDIIWDNNGNSFMLLEEYIDENNSDTPLNKI